MLYCCLDALLQALLRDMALNVSYLGANRDLDRMKDASSPSSSPAPLLWLYDCLDISDGSAYRRTDCWGIETLTDFVSDGGAL